MMTDLLRPAQRSLSVMTTAESGVVALGIYKETVSDELTLRRLLGEACENRASHTLPVGGSIDTSSAIWEFELQQAEGDGNATRTCVSRLLVVDVASVDPLTLGSPTDIRKLEGVTLHKSL